MATGTATRARLRKKADRIRRIPDFRFGMRPHTVTLVQTLYADPDNSAPIETPILNGGANPKVRFLTIKERYAASLEEHAIEVGPITPPFPGGGYSDEDLNPEINGQETRKYVVTGPGMDSCGSVYAVRERRVDRALGYKLVMERSGTGKSTRRNGQ